MAEYTIAPDEVFGRIFWTDLGDQKVSTVSLHLRNLMNPMVGIRNTLFGIDDSNIETAVLDGDGHFVVMTGRAKTRKTAEKHHRRTVEAILAGKVYSQADEPPGERESVLTSPKKLRRWGRQRGLE